MNNVPLNIDWQQILLHLLNFVVLFAILYFLLYKPVKDFMNKRCEHYKNIDDEAKANLEKSEEIKREYEEKLMSADKEIEKKRTAAYQAMQEKNEKSLLLAKEEAEQIISKAHKSAVEERNKLLEDAKTEITDMAAKAAEKIVATTSTSDSYDKFLSSVKRSEADEQ